MANKVHKIDYSADEMLGSVSGEMTPVQFGVYWMICTLIYSRRAGVPNDEKWIAGRFHRSTNPRTVRAAIDALLVMKGGDGEARLVLRTDGDLMVNRCSIELERASNRMRMASEHGMNGGRPRTRIEQNQELEKAYPLFSEKLLPSPSPSPSLAKKPTKKVAASPLGFNEWYSAYPHKVGRGQAMKAFPKALAKADLQTLIDGVQRYIKTKPKDVSWANPATWLNGERWADQPASSGASPAPARPRSFFTADAPAKIPFDPAHAIAAFNIAAERHGLPKIYAMTATRKEILGQRISEVGGLPGWIKTLDAIGTCQNLHQNPGVNFDFLTAPENWAKITAGEGKLVKPPPKIPAEGPTGQKLAG